MARYTYNASLVSQAIEELSSACKALDSTNGEIQKGISTVSSARGAENIDVDFSYITNYQSQVIEYIEMMSTEISGKAQEIEEYQSAPWYKKLFATIGMGALKLVEGLGSFVENLGDGLVSVAGFVGGVFSSDFQDACAEFVKKDHVGDFFYDQYEEGGLQWLNKYSVMSHQSTAANVLKGFGTAAGYITIGVATGGMGTAGLAVSGGAAFLGGVGRGTQDGLQQGLSFNDAFGKGVKQGATAAATTIVVGGLANKLGSLAKGASATDDVIGAADDIIGAADDVAETTTSLATTTGKITAVGDDVVSGLDDTLSITGHVREPGGNVLTVAKNAKGETVLIGAKNGVVQDGLITVTGQQVDDYLNAVVNAGGYVDDLASAGKNGLAVVDDVANASARSIDDVGAAIVDNIDDAASAGKQGIVSRFSNKVDKVVTNFGTNTKVGQTLSNVAAAAGPKVTGGVAAGVGQVTSGGITAPVQAAQFRMAENAGPSVGQKLYDATSGTLQDNLPDFAPQQATITDQTTPTSTGGGQPSGGGGQSSSGGSYSPSGGTGSGSSITQPRVEMSEYPSNTPTTTTPTNPSTPTPTNPSTPTPTNPSNPTIPTTPSNPSGDTGGSGTPSGDTPISGGNQLPGGGGSTGGSTPTVNPGIGGGASGGNYSNLTGNASTGNSNITSDDLMNSLGNSIGSLSDLTTSTMNIPTSSSPILSSDGLSTKSASVIPMVAGLGAAGLAGVGTKTYLDKREKENNEDEEEGLETEEWNEDVDSMNIDYGETENAEADYLTPTDEYAFQEG